jgi:hypothetical protein
MQLIFVGGGSWVQYIAFKGCGILYNTELAINPSTSVVRGGAVV